MTSEPQSNGLHVSKPAGEAPGTSPREADAGAEPRVRLLLLVSSLEEGGAERQVVELANSLDPAEFQVFVCSLSERVPLASGLREHVPLHVIRKKWRFDFGVVLRVARLMRQLRIHVVHGYLFDAEIAGRLAARLAKVPVIVGSERNADYRRPWLHARLLRWTGRWLDALIANSSAGKRFDVRTLSIPVDRIHVIHNGVDTARFRPEDSASARQRLGLPASRPVVGMVASLVPKKNHLMFLRMAHRVRRQVPDVLFVLVGGGLEAEGGGSLLLRAGGRLHDKSVRYIDEVTAELDALGLREDCVFLGRRDDMLDVYNACDLTVLTSLHEGTPNVVLESMACGVPAVVTDVSDNAYVVREGETGYLLDVDAVDAMAERVSGLLRDEQRRRAMGRAAREWVTREFSTQALGEKTASVYRALLAGKSAMPAATVPSNDAVLTR
jgi:glycosyltransferase involved in cell wall biosynthesis